MAGYNPYQTNSYQATQFFPQPQGRDRDLMNAQFQLSQQTQNATLIGTLRPFPQPAYITCSPYQSVGGTCGSSYNCGCGI